MRRLKLDMKKQIDLRLKYFGGCLKSEFDSTYPIHLNGIIRPEEFQESIKNINQASFLKKSLIICGLIFIFCMVGGITLFIVGGILNLHNHSSGLSVLIAVGIGLCVLGVLFICIACCGIRSQRRIRMQQAIANESMKYSTRSPTPCSWRLNVSRMWAGGYGRHGRIASLYQLVIEIGNSGAYGGGNMPYQSVSYFPQKNDMPPPPPYSGGGGQSAAGFCFRCGIPRPNQTARFCSSCGQPFDT